MDVTDVLRDRLHEPDGFERMAVISVVAHGMLIAGLVLTPGRWLPTTRTESKTVMTIMLSGGNGGPNNGGVTSISGKAVQAEPLPDTKRPEPQRAPAAETPKRTVRIPSKTPAKAPTTPAPVVKQAPSEARGRTPTRGAETRAGSAIAETGARGQGFGLSTSSCSGSGVRLDVSDFCCPDYVVLMVEKIRANWNRGTDASGLAVVKYTIQRDGTIVNVELEKSSGFTALDLSAQRAVLATRQLTPLPTGYPNPTLTMHLNFEYGRVSR